MGYQFSKFYNDANSIFFNIKDCIRDKIKNKDHLSDKFLIISHNAYSFVMKVDSVLEKKMNLKFSRKGEHSD
jgi:hypothetical protein